MSRRDETTDAIVIGAGHNGLACALVLAKAGWRVVVVERAAAAGGAIRTEEVTLPGFRHDLFAANLNLFAGSPFFEQHGAELTELGLEFAHSNRPFASVFPDGTAIEVTTNGEETLRSIAAISPTDGQRWRDAEADFDRISPHLMPLLATQVPSLDALRTLRSGRRALGKGWAYELARLALQSPREFAEERFDSEELQALVAAWGMHLDFAPDVAGGAMFPFLETFASARHGMVLGKGGAAAMVDALVAALERAGGEVRLGNGACDVLIESGRAKGVILDDGKRIHAKRAVISNLAPRLLFGPLVHRDVVPADCMAGVDRFRHGPGTLMIHLALNAPLAWSASPTLHQSAYVHVAGRLSDMSLTYAQAQAGLLPAAPALVVGQPSEVDPSRAPDGQHVLWIQVRMVPGVIRGDALGEIDARDWSEAKEALADRILAQLESYAPGLSERVLGRHVLSPADLERYNPNLVGGDSLGGSHHPMQYFFLRPIPGWSRYRTPIESLYMCGASTWPGAGVGAGSGYMLGKQLSRGSRIRRLVSRR